MDFVVETADGLVPLEVKTSATPLPRMAAGMRALRVALGGDALPGDGVHPGASRLPLGDGDRAVALALGDGPALRDGAQAFAVDALRGELEEHAPYHREDLVARAVELALVAAGLAEDLA